LAREIEEYWNCHIHIPADTCSTHTSMNSQIKDG
jgi:hypothetical protein